MVDFWEILARAITNDPFRAALYSTCQDTYYPVDSADAKRLVIPQAAYDGARSVIANVIVDGPVSLMAIGELLMILSSKEFRHRADAVVTAVKGTGVNTTGRSKLFYTAAGIMMLDGTVRDSFANGVFDKPGFGPVPATEQTDLSKLSTAGGPVATAAAYMCELFWGHACDDKLNFYLGHEHPLADTLPA